MEIVGKFIKIPNISYSIQELKGWQGNDKELLNNLKLS